MSQTCNQISDDRYYTCFQCPAVPAQEARPPVVAAVPSFGWDSAARSAELIGGNVFVQFVIQLAAGIACGLAPAPFGVPRAQLLRSTSPSEIAHGFLFEVVNGLGLWSPIEYGQRVGPPRPAPAGATWRVQRFRNDVTWLVNGMPQLTRPALEAGRLMVVGALYSSFDVIGTEDAL